MRTPTLAATFAVFAALVLAGTVSGCDIVRKMRPPPRHEPSLSPAPGSPIHGPSADNARRPTAPGGAGTKATIGP